MNRTIRAALAATTSLALAFGSAGAIAAPAQAGYNEDYAEAMKSYITAYNFFREVHGRAADRALRDIPSSVQPVTAAEKKWKADLTAQIEAARKLRHDAARRMIIPSDALEITGGTAAERKVVKDVLAKVGGKLAPGTRVQIGFVNGGWGSAEIAYEIVSNVPVTPGCGDLITCLPEYTVMAEWPLIKVVNGLGDRLEKIVAHEAQHLRQFAFYGGMKEAYAGSNVRYVDRESVPRSIEFEADLMTLMQYGTTDDLWYARVYRPAWTAEHIKRAKKVLDGTGGWKQPTITGASKPTISGTAKVGKALTAKPDKKVSVATPKITYQWLRNGSLIPGATKVSYKLVKADKGKKVSVRVTYSAQWFAAKSVTSATKKVS